MQGRAKWAAAMDAESDAGWARVCRTNWSKGPSAEIGGSLTPRFDVYCVFAALGGRHRTPPVALAVGACISLLGKAMAQGT